MYFHVPAVSFFFGGGTLRFPFTTGQKRLAGHDLVGPLNEIGVAD